MYPVRISFCLCLLLKPSPYIFLFYPNLTEELPRFLCSGLRIIYKAVLIKEVAKRLTKEGLTGITFGTPLSFPSRTTAIHLPKRNKSPKPLHIPIQVLMRLCPQKVLENDNITWLRTYTGNQAVALTNRRHFLFLPLRTNRL